VKVVGIARSVVAQIHAESKSKGGPSVVRQRKQGLICTSDVASKTERRKLHVPTAFVYRMFDSHTLGRKPHRVSQHGCRSKRGVFTVFRVKVRLLGDNVVAIFVVQHHLKRHQQVRDAQPCAVRGVC
jgi:hypothetical protein